MNLSMPTYIEGYITLMLHTDAEIIGLISEWHLDRSDVTTVLVDHYLSLGIYSVHPFEHEEVIRGEMLYHLKHSSQIQRLRKGKKKTKTKTKSNQEI